MTPHPHPADFIEVYHDALDAATCRAIVARFDASRQAGERYHVTVRKGWLGDFAIMPEALRAAARSGEVVQ